jgi:hypothetical protein
MTSIFRINNYFRSNIKYTDQSERPNVPTKHNKCNNTLDTESGDKF